MFNLPHYQKPLLGTPIKWSHPLAKGLVGCWLFNENGGSRVYDVSGKNNRGTLTNMAFPATASSGWHPGRTGQALKFDGVNDYVGLASNVVMAGSGSSFSAWCSLNAFVTIIVGKASNNHTYIYFQNSTTIVVQTDTVDTYKSFTVPTMSLGTWYHVSVTRKSNITRVYLNGVESSSGGQSQSPDLTINQIGRYSTGDLGVNFNGLIDEVRIYNRALTPSEVFQLYLTPYAMFEEDPIWWMVQQAGAVTYTKTVSLDALIQKAGITKTVSMDAFIQRQNIEATTQMDALLQSLEIVTTSLDALIQKQDITKTASLDALIQKADITKTASMDAHLAAVASIVAQIDALLQKPNIILTASMDALIQKAAIAVTISLDALIQKAGILKTASMDAILVKQFTKTANLDALLVKEGITLTAQLDALIQKASIAKTVSMDALLSKVITVTANMDALLMSTKTVTAGMDAVLEWRPTVTAGMDALLASWQTLPEIVLLSDGNLALKLESEYYQILN